MHSARDFVRPLLHRTRVFLEPFLRRGVSRCQCFDPLENLVIFSDPRGGSTWITEAINRIPNTVVLWEPLHLREVDRFQQLEFAWRQFIPESAQWPEAIQAFTDVFSGKVLNPWTCQGNSAVDFWRAERMVVKFCRANAMIPWLTANFALRYRPIYLVRHPFAVAASQMEHGAWGKEFRRFEVPDCPYNEPYIEHADYLRSLQSMEESLVAMWCLTNGVPLENPRNNVDWITIFYEDLIANPKMELTRVFQSWGLTIPGGVFEGIRKPSATTKDADCQAGVEAQVAKWTRYFRADQVERLTAVLEYFNMRQYDSDLYPCKGRATEPAGRRAGNSLLRDAVIGKIEEE